jgi:ribosomal protein L11 methyltransferase
VPWLALTLEVAPAQAEALSDALMEQGAQSVWIEEPEHPRSRLHALLAQEADPAALLASAAAQAGMQAPAFALQPVADQDWVRATQAQFAPLCLGGRLWIVPSWHEAPCDPHAAVVRLDPGMAFGTGSHPSTRLVLRWLARTLAPAASVLDYGCGSGILAIAAAKLGAAHVDAVDLDPKAVETTRANAAANGVALNPALPDALPAAGYDIVVSNILAQPLIVLAPLLASRAARIALSGILEAQAEEVMQAYRPWLDMKLAEREEGWVLLTGEGR